jgi:hypothetical protein
MNAVPSLVLFSLLAFLRAWSATTLVGDPKNPGTLPQAILDAHAHGATDITIAPGTYYISSQNHGDTLALEDWNDTTIHATGVTLVFEELAHAGVLFHHCHRVSWDGGTLRFAQPAYTQGRIESITPDASGIMCTWRLDAGYPTKLQDSSCFNVVDPATRRLKIGVGDQSCGKLEQISPDVFHLHYRPGQKFGFAVNDWLVARTVGGNSVVIHDDCDACTTANVTLQNGGWGAFFEHDGAGANRYLHCTVEPGPRPAGATEEELVGGGADGLHSNATRTGPDIEDFTCRGVFSDDCIAIHGMLHRVLQTDGVRVRTEGFHPLPGDPLRVASVHGFFAQATITKVEPNADGTVWLTLDRDLHVPADSLVDKDPKGGTQASDPDECGAGYRILGCHLGDTRSRGILVKGDNGVIDGTTLDGCGMSAISIGPEFWWREAGYSWHVVVSNNQIIGCGQENADQAALYIHGDGAIGNQDIVVKNNRFIRNYGTAIADLEWADGVELTDNHFDGSFPLPPPGNKGHILNVTHCRNVKLLGNTVTNQRTGAGDLVQRDPSVTASDIQGNDASGISISKAVDSAGR